MLTFSSHGPGRVCVRFMTTRALVHRPAFGAVHRPAFETDVIMASDAQFADIARRRFFANHARSVVGHGNNAAEVLAFSTHHVLTLFNQIACAA